MISVLISWITIFAASWIVGYFTVKVLYRDSREFLWKPDVYLVCGLMVINVYAQVFSLFYKVGAKACLLLFILGMVGFGWLVFSAKRNGEGGLLTLTKQFKWSDLVKHRKSILLIAICTAATLFWTTTEPSHYDTYLYHIQAIRWIEEYGVVPGLGNIHFRFAYNSAFMPLQALFSLEWLIGQSLHTVNGYICCMAIIYALKDNRLLKNERLELSDLLKITMLIYAYYDRNYISSPNSDTLTMFLILYICTKWSEYIENEVDDALPYTYLCVVGIWAVTVKLSAGVCIILALYPLVLLIKRKQWKAIAVNLCAGIIIILPWLARNVMISGYLLYPYSQLDFFSVDWKMPASVVTYDAREIMVWGRNIKNVDLYDMHIWEWFPTWFKNGPQLIIVSGFVSAVALGVSIIYGVITGKRQDIRRSILFGYSILALLAWLFSAPLIRYGRVYLLIPICGAVWIILDWKKDIDKIQKGVQYIAALLMIPLCCIYISSWGDIERLPKIIQENYKWFLTNTMEIADGINVWYPAEGDLGSYDVFPCVPYKGMIEKVEVRGDGLEEGFRLKEQYADKHLNGAGQAW